MENSNQNLSQISDQNLLTLCEQYGANALMWRRKFIGLLPEVNSSRLYERKGFFSIYEFAEKLAGLSERQVDTALNFNKKGAFSPQSSQ